MNKTLHGRIRGKIIQLDEDPGMVEGQEVEIQVKAVAPSQSWGDGIRRSAGGWEDYPELDSILNTIQHERNLERSAQVDYE